MTEQAVKVWGDYTQEELNAQYNQGTLIPNSSDYADRNAAESARVRDALDCTLDVVYGAAEEQKLDIFPAPAAGAPVVIYSHGGAWTRSNKEGTHYLAENFVGKGLNYVTLEFTLAPKASLDEMVSQVRDGVKWVYDNAASFGGDPNRIIMTGHSSGGHLAGMMTVTDWEKERGIPGDVLKAALCGSGMYDLEPVRLSARNDYLHLDEEAARRNSSILQIPSTDMPLVMCIGGGELDEFRRQNKAFAAAWEKHGNSVQLFDLPGLNHFEVGQQYANPDAPFIKALYEVIGI